MSAVAGAQTRALFYLTDSAESLASFYRNAPRIDIVVPVWYRTNGQGVITGTPHPRVLQAARQAGVAVMPIVVNPGFRTDVFHQLANSSTARARLIRSLIEECKTHGLAGIQFDFEGVAAADGPALTRLVEEAGEAFRAAGKKLSLAAIPRSFDRPSRSVYGQYVWSRLQGAYDVQRLGQAVDFLTWMTYDQHTRFTTPGPVAGYPWVVDQLQYLLRHVPKEKISLGIPQYGRRWYSDKGSMRMATVSALEAKAMAAGRQIGVEWDPAERAPWFWFPRDEVREWVFFNDARAFAARLELARAQGLHSFSVWVLGMEDPELWKQLPARSGRLQ